jgi:hypothetical protein
MSVGTVTVVVNSPLPSTATPDFRSTGSLSIHTDTELAGNHPVPVTVSDAPGATVEDETATPTEGLRL